LYIQDVVSLSDLNDEILAFYKALGVDMVQVDLRAGVSRINPDFDPRDGQDCTEVFEKARAQIEAHGLKLNAVFSSCWEEISLARPDADEKIEAWCRMLESLGRAGIPHLGWNFKPMGNFRTAADKGRGGVDYSSFDQAVFDQKRPPAHKPEVNADQMWARMEGFLKAVIPVAQKAKVRMALHPDDPPVPASLAGVAQICSTPAHFRRIFDSQPSTYNAMLFCQGCMTECLGDQVYGAIEEMAAADRIAWVHFRNVRGMLPCFNEVFIDEGDVDMRRAMELYRDNGFNGAFMMDHTPSFPQKQAGWAGKAYAIGYIRALIQTVYA